MKAGEAGDYKRGEVTQADLAAIHVRRAEEVAWQARLDEAYLLNLVEHGPALAAKLAEMAKR